MPNTSTAYTRAATILKAFRPTIPRNLLHRLRRYLPRPTFLLLHWAYIITTCMVSSIIFWHLSTPRGYVSYVDSLFLIVAATTQAGLNTVNLSSLNTFQQCIIFVHIILGNPIFVSAFVVHVRKHAFHTRFRKVAEDKQSKKKTSSSTGVQPVTWQSSFAANSESAMHPRQTLHCASNSSHNYRLRIDPSLTSMGSKAEDKISPTQSTHDHYDDTLRSSNGAQDPRCFSSPLWPKESRHLRRGTVDRNAQFHSLSFEEREHIRCVEYQAVRLLSYVVPIYIVAWQLFGCIALGTYMSCKGQSAAAANAVNPWWAGTFYAIASFNNVGMSLLDASVIPFQRSVFFLSVMGILMLAGNTAYPVLLRSILRTTLYLLPNNDQYRSWRETIDFVLRYPRRVYTNLFPSAQTWWLFFILAIFNAIDWTGFEILNRNNPLVTAIPIGYRLLDGLFQSLAVRSSRFAIIPIGSLAVGLQALYIMMMYISAFPVVITMRNSNVYEERSLGIYAQDIKEDQREQEFRTPNSVRKMRMYFVRTQIQRQLGHDLWFVIACMILIIWIETDSYEKDPITYSIFSIIFEVVSAYGCVGLSIGLPNQAYSFCGAWHASGKLVLCALMLRGRHRGLPVAIDKAIQLPGDRESMLEEEDHGIRVERSRHESRVGV
ncbi:TrkH-domain-containing protein [Hyaloscypha bicolor E]|uniref:TrkH-domain-containing protein n=1 Tax=Hyaloscypha bicolor E TaxID=1095630 RepID=A0A2J6SQY2_9HELO|nr:TrkH-domain-containing protein [Hyaloscypha bicolor E]PMD53149.1 TrkH-domain-containing protein [Hyaloscypha bicolor E]